jgi:hypothetical protein
MAEDPGLAYLYKPSAVPAGSRRPRAEQQQAKRVADPNTQQQQEAVLTMQHLARDPAHVNADAMDWGACIGNMHNAKLAVETLQSLVSDAVFLDDEAFTNASTLQQYQTRIQVRPAWRAIWARRVLHGARSARPAPPRERPPPPPSRAPRHAPQAQQRRMLGLQHEAEALRAEVQSKDVALAEAAAAQRRAALQISELQGELENNARVFAMHYEEMLLKNEEIGRLTAIIEGLGGT